MDILAGKMGNKEVVIVRSESVRSNAGICTQILADLFQVDAVINTGIAGSLKAEINIGDIVVLPMQFSMIWMRPDLAMSRV